MSNSEQEPQADSIESVTSELRLALEGFRQATRTLVDATDKAGNFMPEELLFSGEIKDTEYSELHDLWLLSPGDEVLSLLGVEG